MGKIVWIVGGSTGIGYQLCKLYIKDGWKVIISSRDPFCSKELQLLKKQYKENLTLIPIDVGDTNSVELATKKAWDSFGFVDLCIYNAGIYESMRCENWDIKNFEEMTQINYLGAIRITTALTRYFLENNKGHFVFNASVSSFFGLPYGGGYSAPKAALLNFCESIYPELKKKNITVQVINHGFVKTRLTDKNQFKMPQLLEPSQAASIIFDKVKDKGEFQIKFPFLLTSFLHFLRVIPYKIGFYFSSKAL